jgi:hypothetical protein
VQQVKVGKNDFVYTATAKGYAACGLALRRPLNEVGELRRHTLGLAFLGGSFERMGYDVVPERLITAEDKALIAAGAGVRYAVRFDKNWRKAAWASVAGVPPKRTRARATSAGVRRHYPDLVLLVNGYAPVAIEFERTRKVDADYQAILAGYRRAIDNGQYSQVVYYSDPARADYSQKLQAAAEAVGMPAGYLEVRMLPQGILP